MHLIQQSSNNLENKAQELNGMINETSSKEFPKKIGIVFLGEKRTNFKSRKSNLYLDFDEVACSHLLLQMNYVQNLFEFQIIAAPDFVQSASITTKGDDYKVKWFDDSIQSFSIKGDDYIVQWFDKTILSALENDSSIDYWIGITSQSIGENYFFRTRKGIPSDRILSVITSEYWERDYSPPSVFEYIVISTFTCSLHSLSLDFRKEFMKYMSHDETRGCVFDFTGDKPYRRILVSSPNLCSTCTENMQQLEIIIKNKTASRVPLCELVGKILSRKWLGSLKREYSPIYNLKRNYGYDVDRNSGFYKRPWEKFIDSIIENSAEWTIGGIIATALSVFGAYVIHVFI